MSPLARVLDERVGDIAVAAVDGEIDASNARELGDRLRSAMTNRSHALVVDLSATAYLDSAAVNLLFELDQELAHRRQQLHLIVPPGSPIRRVLDIAGVGRTIAMHETRAAALERAAGDAS